MFAPGRSQIDFLAIQRLALAEIFGADAAGIECDQLIEFRVGEAGGIKLSRQQQEFVGLFLDLAAHPVAEGVPEQRILPGMLMLLGHNHGLQNAVGLFQDIGAGIGDVQKLHRLGDMGIVLQRRQFFRRLVQQLVNGLGGERAECGQSRIGTAISRTAFNMNKAPI